MSNNQWNTGQNPEWAPQQPEGAAPEQQGQQQQEWGQQTDWTQQGQTSATEWGQPQPQTSAQDWQGAQAQPQPSAGDWQQAQPQQSAQDWQAAQSQGSADWNQAQPQPSAQDWGQAQQAQSWDQGQQQWGQQGQQGQQGQSWDQNQQWNQQQGGYANTTGGYSGAPQQWNQQAEKKPSPFDFSFKRQALPGAAGTIFLIGTIGLAVWWLFHFIGVFSFSAGLSGDVPIPMLLERLLGGAALAVFGIMLLRAILEVGVAVTGLLNKPDPASAKDDDKPAEDTAV